MINRETRMACLDVLQSDAETLQQKRVEHPKNVYAIIAPYRTRSSYNAYLLNEILGTRATFVKSKSNDDHVIRIVYVKNISDETLKYCHIHGFDY